MFTVQVVQLLFVLVLDMLHDEVCGAEHLLADGAHVFLALNHFHRFVKAVLVSNLNKQLIFLRILHLVFGTSL